MDNLTDGYDSICTSEEGHWREYGNQRLQRQLTAAASMNKRVAKNVVIFVGDGMGPQVILFLPVYVCTRKT